jgi:membrane-associated phospholipid phosphatase
VPRRWPRWTSTWRGGSRIPSRSSTPCCARGLGRGLFHDRYQSFPSGHTAAAFATAAALTTEIGYRAPDLKVWSGTLLYGTAALVGISRMYHNAHWASDGVVGAAIGTFAGWKVVRHHHTHPGNTVDEALLAREPAPPLLLVWRVRI